MIIAVTGDFIVPYILAIFYPRYSHTKQVMSVLGCPDSPVKTIYNSWLIVLGVLFLFSGIKFYLQYENISGTLSLIGMIILCIYGLGACILAGIFSVNETKRLETLPEKIHGIAAGIGFIALLFMPLIIGLIYLKNDQVIIGYTSVIIFIGCIFFFTLFIMSEKKTFENTWIAHTGLWQRFLLGTMYLPLSIISITNYLS